MADFKILSLDGGGIRGAFGASYLAELENVLNRPITDYFDLVVGTSTGAILAAAAIRRIPMAVVVELYKEQGSKVFSRRHIGLCTRLAMQIGFALFRALNVGLQLDSATLLRSKYVTEELEEQLVKILGEVKFSDIRRRLLLPSINSHTGQIKVFKTPHIPHMTVDRDVRLVDAVLASAAAPTYFNPKAISQLGGFIDGGLWANNPALAGLTEAIRISRECQRSGIDEPVDIDTIRVLSVGTGTLRFSHSSKVSNPGLLWWAPKLVETSFIAQAQGVNFQMKHLLGERYERVDFNVPDNSWTLDNLDVVPALCAYGHSAAHEAGHRKRLACFFQETAKDFTTFESGATYAK